MDSRRGGSARQVHQKVYTKANSRSVAGVQPAKCILPNGPDTGSIGSEVLKWTARQCGSRRVGGTWPKTTKNVNAKTSTKGEVAISGMGVKFSTRTAKAALAV